MVSKGVKYAIIEATSHALDQNRVAFVPFKVAVITNVTHEHLDYHKTYKNYLLAKAKILHGVKYRVLNAEDSSFEKLKMLGTGQLVSFGSLDSDYFGEEINSFEGSTNYAIHYRTKQKQLKTLQIITRLTGEFNFSNILASFAVAKVLGIEDKKVTGAISTFGGVEGRMEEINKGQDFKVVVDFAHTPKALESILLAARKFTKNRIICVFGAASERDIRKRAMMGALAARLADLSIFTSEDPRKESPEKIIEDIAAGAIKAGALINKDYWKIKDRREAIKLSIKNLATSGDTVLILGKGHEKSMNIGGKEMPWSDRLEAETALEERLNK
jgi:UDP-N-acetylmuramoyl-L-alanyl-D-glutamate--2,6-diaminopimelate ligase